MWSVSKTVMAVPKLLLLCLLAAGCAVPPASPAPKAKPAAPEAIPAPTPTPAPIPPPLPPKTVVLDSGGEKAGSANTSLADAARAAREQNAHAAPPAHVITDKNIKQYAAKGQITVAAPARKTEAAEAEETAPVRDEQYWRSRALEVRLRWRKAADGVKELEQSAAGWRRRFYAENDPYVRSGQVKPEWDRVLDRLEEARAEADTAKKELAELLEEGRSAGALPGWLREGVDEEPQEEPEPSNEHKAIEPPVVEPPQ
jgi:hypothetical protein